MSGHLSLPILSPAIMERIGTRFRRDVAAFAKAGGGPMVVFKKGDRKRDVMDPHCAGRPRPGCPGVAAIGLMQEYQNVLAATERTDHGRVWFSFYKTDRRVTCFCFYLWAEQVRAGVCQDLQLLPVSGQGLGQSIPARLACCLARSWPGRVRMPRRSQRVRRADLGVGVSGVVIDVGVDEVVADP